jgi:hypothetical protein
MEKLYLEDFLDKLTKMIEESNTPEQYELCIKYIHLYKEQLKDTIKNDIFRQFTLNYLDEFIDQINEKLIEFDNE